MVVGIRKHFRVTSTSNIKMSTKSKCQAPERFSVSRVLKDDLEFRQLKKLGEGEESQYRQKDRIGNDRGMRGNVTCSALSVRRMGSQDRNLKEVKLER